MSIFTLIQQEEMMKIKQPSFYWYCLLFWAGIISQGAFLTASAQSADTVGLSIPFNRLLWHEQIDTIQVQLDRADGLLDGKMQLTADIAANEKITEVLYRQTDALQREVEIDSGNHNRKVGQLRSIKEMLQSYQNQIRLQKKYVPFAPELFNAFRDCMAIQNAGFSMESVFRRVSHTTGSILLQLFPGRPEAIALKNIIFLKRVADYPDIILKEIPAFASAPFADSLIAVESARRPLEVYAYAQAGESVQASLIRDSKDRRTRMLASLAAQTNGALLLPFLDDLTSGDLHPDTLSVLVDDPRAYYKLLVQTAIRYQSRMILGDTSEMIGSLSDRLKRQASEVFVQVMNDLHDEAEPIRFRVAEDLTAAEIYYLIVSTEDIIYTSTYTQLFKRMMERSPGNRGDSLLMLVQLDHFKKFIKMAADYNRLDEFLKSMPEQSSKQLVYAFANGLQQTRSLEDAVDVADSYASIVNPSIRKVIKEQVLLNYQNAQQQEDQRGELIYGILNTLFQSQEDTTLNVSDILGIPSVYRLPYAALADDSGRVVQQVFFYGDEDGVNAYNRFIRLFQSKTEWRVITKPEWVEIFSIKAKNFTIYANLPLDNKTDLDQQAQENLLRYLQENKIAPSIVVHRGHSYHLKYTLRQLMPSAEIVVLGSCGGYQNLGKLLDINENAHVISTKQVGSYSVNDPVLKLINEYVRSAKNIEWIPFWKQLFKNLQNDSKATALLKDYIPPHQNQGLLFMKAYRKRFPVQ
ncbi:MAG: hypothetical protein KGP35_00020 [Bacteroidetes bacterium]|nr:hypothetical protein [Bacteroidota bacterium]